MARDGDQQAPEATGLAVATFAQRPDLLDKVFGPEIQSAVPEFMRHDPVAALYYGAGRLDRYREFGLAAIDQAEPDRPIARAFSVPFAFRDRISGREELPDGGWDAVIRWADEDRRAARPATAISALEIMVAPRLQRRGISRLMLTALRDNARRLGFADLYAPLRPTDKQREPLTPFADYVARQREDGLPHDSWVRTHVRAGARIVKVAPCSMVVAGTIAEWSQLDGPLLHGERPGNRAGRALTDPRLARAGSRGLCRAEFMGTPPARLSPSVAVPLSPRLQHVDDAACDPVAGFGGVSRHVRRGGVRPQRLGALPFLDHDESVGPELGLKASDPLGIDRRAIFDAALLGMHRGHIGAEFLEDRFAHAGLGGDDGDDVDHVFPLRSGDAFKDAVVAGGG